MEGPQQARDAVPSARREWGREPSLAGVRGAWPVLGATLVVALSVRVLCAVRRSLWLDELHTLHHASAPDLAALVRGLLPDNHPPLSFLLVRLSRSLLGDSELALRAPSILCGTAVVYLTFRLARRFEGPLAPLLAPALVAVSSLHVVASAEARMYALLSLAVLGLTLALLDARDGKPASVRVALWTTVGLHTHYFFLHALACALLAAALLFALEPGRRQPLARCWPGFAAAALASLPWYLTGFREQLFGHALGPGGHLDPLRSLPEAIVHLVYYNLALAPDALRPVFLGGALLMLGLSAAGIWRALSRGGGSRPFGAAVLAGALGLGLPLWAAASAWLFPRSGFNWIYLAGCTAPFATLVAAQAPRALPALGVGAVVATAGLLTGFNAVSPGTEDYRGAVRSILAAWEPGDAVLAIDPGPELFPPALGWSYYAPRLAPAGVRPPAPVPLTGDHRLPPGEELPGHARAFVLQRGLHDGFPTLERLRELYATERTRRFGYSLWVHEFSGRR